jgi:hypothetical protein
MLRDIALDSFEGVSETESLAAVDALADASAERMLAQIAKTSMREEIGLRALARLQQAASPSNLFASVARHSPLEPVRQEAFGRVHDRADVLAVAINGEFKEIAVAAVDRLAEREDLEQVAVRAKTRGAAKRASAMLRELDERAARQAAPPVAALELEIEDQVMSVEVPVEMTIADTSAAQEREHEEEAARVREEAEAKQRAEAQAAEHARAAREAEQAAAEQRARGEAEAAQEAERRRQASEAEARARREGLSRLNQLLGRAESLAQKPELSLKTAARLLRDVRTALADVPPLPSRHDYEDVVQRLKAVQATLTPKVQDLREVAEWQQWANIGIQEQLCEKMEALRTADDPEAIARRIRELQEQWRQAADVPRSQGEALWKRFKAAHDELWTRCQAHFAAQASVRSENLVMKTTLCERAEALADSTNWLATAETIKGLQAEWKTVGPVTRGQEKAIWERFRAACDRFFTRRQDDLARRKAIWTENFTRKEALCVAVEAMAASTDWDRTSAEIRRLQAEWKAIGPVKKSRSEAIWQRFRAACDAFFVRHAQR